ncbi:sensor histidine kinase [Streptomyces sp. NPDC018045]|uniref:sensor histidine kinase n=1 Tax=Streptomyces sp. NPDC018045 TaxID=3365037 RepID=UPI0037A02F8C
MLSRLPTHVRTAVLAGFVALLLAATGAWWLRQHLYDAQYESTLDKARLQARTVARNLALPGNAPGIVPGQLDWPYVVLTPRGGIGTGGGGAVDLAGLEEQLPPAPADAPEDWSTTRSVHTSGLDTDHAPGRRDPAARHLTHRTLTAVAAAIDISPGVPTMFGTAGGRYTVYVLALPDTAQTAVDDLTPPLLAGIPLAALLVSVTASVATRRALRPVEAIRTQLADISEQNLDRRVPIPRAKDEISRLANTTNATLDRLQHAVEQQRRLVADASHELRSPLTALRSQLEISLARPDRTNWPRATSDALTATHRLQALTEDLLFLTRPRTEPPAPALVDLTALIRELTDEARRTRPDGPATTAHMPPSAPVRGNALHLQRLLRNLLDNALRHARTAVTITVSRDDVTTTVAVHNDGSPIAPDDRERIFDRFTRLDEARSRDVGGTGLGLAIARDIAQRHHGTLHATTPPTPGATFLLQLPTPPAPPPASAPQS